MQGLIKLKELPHFLSELYLDEAIFWSRFRKIYRFEDPFVRSYDVCRDISNNTRVAVKDYCANTQRQCKDVLLNLQAYRGIQKMEEICKLVAFTQQKQTGDIRAAFQYNDQSLQELVSKRYCQQNRNEFYLFLFKEMLFAIRSLSNIGISLEQITLTNLMLYKNQECFRLKVLYDQREKKYDKIQEGLKIFCSSTYLNRALQQSIQIESNNQEEQAIYQLGLMLLDIFYEYQSTSYLKPTRKSQQPLQKDSYLFKGYLIFQGNQHCSENQGLINLKIKYLLQRKDQLLGSLIFLIKKMICQSHSRINIQELFLQVQSLNVYKQKANLAHQLQKSKKGLQLNPKEISPIKSKGQSMKQLDSLRYSDSYHSSAKIKKAVISQTTVETIGTSNFINLDSRSQAPHVQPHKKVQFFIIPIEKFKKLNCHIDLRKKLQIFLIELQNKSNLQKKDYYDNNVYYGQIEIVTQKRSGVGVYIYNQGDIYFGVWKQNSLIQGTYIFKNDEGFQGIVRGGKQGKGKYYYSNGNIYEGDWANDMKHGYGKMYYSNSQSYDGMWVKGKKSGEGTYFYKDGAIFKGIFSNGKKQGPGSINFSDGTRVEAIWQDNLVQGKGKIFYKNGNYFEGTFKSSQKDGKGAYRWDGLIQYQGDFRSDQIEGQGFIRFGQYEFYQGHIKMGKREGEGFYRYVNGDEFRGEWKNDEKHSGQYKFFNRNSFEGRFKNGEFSYGVMIYVNGQSYEGEFFNGLRNGKGVYRNPQGALKYQGRWQNDKFISSS